MQKGFILIFGALRGRYLPATAQTLPTQVNPMQERNASIMRLMAAAPTHLPLSGSLLIQPLEEPPARFNILPGAAYTFDQSLEHLSPVEVVRTTDRKSTRLNSSHLVISYAVFCLKKKKK